jgi:hypothetical protein
LNVYYITLCRLHEKNLILIEVKNWQVCYSGMVPLMLRNTFWKDFDDQNFICTFNYGFFLLSPLYNESNILQSHLSNLSSPQGKLGLKFFW